MVMSVNIESQSILIQTHPFPTYTSTVSGVSSEWMYFRMTGILFSVKTNALGLHDIPFTKKSLLFPHNTCINMHNLPFVPIFLGPYSVFQWTEYSSIVI